MTATLKYPPGEFTNAELAAFNGMEKADVYLLMKEAVAKGILNFSGTRPTGKRPANLYQVASNNAPVPVPAPPMVQPSADIIETPVQPLPYIETASVVLVPQSIIEITPLKEQPPVIMSAPNPAYPCPLCQRPMTEISDDEGVTVKCYNSPCDIQCHENPFGHDKNAKNAKDAYEIAKQKFHL